MALSILHIHLRHTDSHAILTIVWIDTERSAPGLEDLINGACEDCNNIGLSQGTFQDPHTTDQGCGSKQVIIIDRETYQPFTHHGYIRLFAIDKQRTRCIIETESQVIPGVGIEV